MLLCVFTLDVVFLSLRIFAFLQITRTNIHDLQQRPLPEPQQVIHTTKSDQHSSRPPRHQHRTPNLHPRPADLYTLTHLHSHPDCQETFPKLLFESTKRLSLLFPALGLLATLLSNTLSFLTPNCLGSSSQRQQTYVCVFSVRISSSDERVPSSRSSRVVPLSCWQVFSAHVFPFRKASARNETQQKAPPPSPAATAFAHTTNLLFSDFAPNVRLICFTILHTPD